MRGFAAEKNPGCAVTRAGGNVVFGLDRTNAQQLKQICATSQ
jgi:hypothetical protein